MTRSRRLVATGFAAALALAGIAIGAGSSSASTGGGLCEGIDIGALAGAAADDEAEAEDTEAMEDDAEATEAEGTDAEAAEAEADGTTVALLFDVTGRGDKSFNDAAAAGLDEAVADFGVVGSESTPSGEADRAERLSAAAEGGNELVIAVGFLWTDTVAQGAPQFPDTNFALVDSVVEEDNVANLLFAEEQGSFLVGAAAALESESGTVGFIGGVPIPLIQKFEAGFVAGVECIDPDVDVLVEYISDDPAIGFNDPARGREIGTAMYDAGADVVYAAAGASGLGALEAAGDAGEPGEVWNIGVDSDLYELADPELQPYVLTSMLKRVDVATYSVIEAQVNGEFAGGIQEFDLAIDGVGYSTSGGFVDEHVPTLDGLKALIVDGTIEVPAEP